MGPQHASPTVFMGWVEINKGINKLAICHGVGGVIDKTTFSKTDKLHISKTQYQELRYFSNLPKYFCSASPLCLI